LQKLHTLARRLSLGLYERLALSVSFRAKVKRKREGRLLILLSFRLHFRHDPE
jgi:hypothetical protein